MINLQKLKSESEESLSPQSHRNQTVIAKIAFTLDLPSVSVSKTFFIRKYEFVLKNLNQ